MDPGWTVYKAVCPFCFRVFRLDHCCLFLARFLRPSVSRTVPLSASPLHYMAPPATSLACNSGGEASLDVYYFSRISPTASSAYSHSQALTGA
jgi:hypothetical protein